jgi:uncharacterized glyoxalase superfamily protein PhnB
MTITIVAPNLTFDGRCEEAFTHYANLFGGKIEAMMRCAGSPMEKDFPPESQQKMLHARMGISGHIITGSEAPPAVTRPRKGSRSSSAWTMPRPASVSSTLSPRAARSA